LFLEYAEIQVRNELYLPSLLSELGRDVEYLQGVYYGWFQAPWTEEIEEIKLMQAPLSTVLLEMLKYEVSKYNSENCAVDRLDLGLHLGKMPDVQYMINMIYYFNPITPLR